MRIDNVRVSCPGGTSYCTSSPNSTGSSALIGDSGEPSLGGNAYGLSVAGATPGQPGIFYLGDQQLQVPFGDGQRCVGGSTTRISPPLFLDQAGAAERPLDLATLPMITAGSSWNFQFWYRDPGGPGGTGFNLSDGLSVTFCD